MLTKLRTLLTSPAANYIRAMLYVAFPSALLTLVDQHKLTQDAANLWIGLGLAVASPALATVFAPNGWRTYVFGVVAAVQAALVGFGHNAWFAVGAAVLGSFISSGFAAANVTRAGSVTPAKDV
jgi:hypothetical protein